MAMHQTDHSDAAWLTFDEGGHAENLTASLARDVRRGLQAQPKWLPSKYFYNALGSTLFARIAELEEYYQARTEHTLLEACAANVMEMIGPNTLVELGPGPCTKSRVLLAAMDSTGLLKQFIPVDVTRAPLETELARIHEEYPSLLVHAVIGDFEHELHRIPEGAGRRLFAYLGGTLGNLPPEMAVKQLSGLRKGLHQGEALLLGLHLMNDRHALMRSYDDSQGLTAAFNKNVLAVVNTQLNADFDLEAFRHIALFNEPLSRMEMHLEAREAQRVHIRGLDLQVRLEAGERIWTELSYKYTRDAIRNLMAEAELRVLEIYVDGQDRVALALVGLLEA